MSAACNKDDERQSVELLGLGQRGELIALAREQA
jgi:hypothetical protein